MAVRHVHKLVADLWHKQQGRRTAALQPPPLQPERAAPRETGLRLLRPTFSAHAFAAVSANAFATVARAVRQPAAAATAAAAAAAAAVLERARLFAPCSASLAALACRSRDFYGTAAAAAFHRAAQAPAPGAGRLCVRAGTLATTSSAVGFAIVGPGECPRRGARRAARWSAANAPARGRNQAVLLLTVLAPFPGPSLQAEARALQREQAVAVLQRHADSATADLRGCLAELRAERERVAVGQEEEAKLRDGAEDLRMELKGASRKVCGACGDCEGLVGLR